MKKILLTLAIVLVVFSVSSSSWAEVEEVSEAQANFIEALLEKVFLGEGTAYWMIDPECAIENLKSNHLAYDWLIWAFNRKPEIGQFAVKLFFEKGIAEKANVDWDSFMYCAEIFSQDLPVNAEEAWEVYQSPWLSGISELTLSWIRDGILTVKYGEVPQVIFDYQSICREIRKKRLCEEDTSSLDEVAKNILKSINNGEEKEKAKKAFYRILPEIEKCRGGEAIFGFYYKLFLESERPSSFYSYIQEMSLELKKGIESLDSFQWRKRHQERNNKGTPWVENFSLNDPPPLSVW